MNGDQKKISRRVSKVFPSIRLSADLLDEICKIFDGLSDEETTLTLSYKKHNMDEYEFNDVQTFLQEIQTSLKTVKSFHMRLSAYRPSRRIFDLSIHVGRLESEYIFEGPPNWTRNLEGIMNEFIENHRTKNNFVRSRSFKLIMIGVFISSLFYFGSILDLIYPPSSRLMWYPPIITVLLYSFNVSFASYVLIQWLFPMTETGFMTRVKARTQISVGLILGVTSSILGSYIFQFLD